MDAELESTSSGARARRAVALIVVSVVVIVATCVVYVRPSLPAATSSRQSLGASYRVAAVHFVSASVGWVIAALGDGNLVVVHTTDAGATWTRQLSVAADVHPLYMDFFDRRVGLLALVGTTPNLFRTDDGGETWHNLPALTPDATVISWSFVNDTYGWMLARMRESTKSAGAATLFRTSDGGRTWTDLGVPVPPPAQAYQVDFSYVTTGWLTTSGPSPVAYRSVDFGATWQQVELPSPAGDWPSTGEFFVGVQPTSGVAAIASVVPIAPLKGRTNGGGIIRSFPPLTVRSFDGGRPYTYLYTTVLDRLVPGGRTGTPAPGETVLSTLDNGASWSFASDLPDGGALAYFEPGGWWWIGGSELRTSADGGVTWSGSKLVNAAEPLPGLLQIVDSRHAWLAGANGPNPVLQRTDDGVHWRTVALPAL